MLDLSAANMLDEVRAAKEYTEYFLKDWTEDMGRYHGPGYRKDYKTDLTDPENHAFEWVSLVVPQLIFGNPRVKVGTTRIGAQRDVAKAMQFGLNRWSRDTNLRNVNEKLGVDFGMKWAVAITMPGYTEGFSETEDPRNWPTVKRLSPRRFIWDHLATEMEEARFKGHVTIRDKDDLLREAKKDETWNMQGLKEITEGYGVNEFRNEEFQEGYPARKEIAYYDLWVPEINGDNVGLLKEYGVAPPRQKYVKGKHHGIWVTLGIGQSGDGDPKAAYIREARWFWGPRSGPYTWIGCYVVPDEAAPLAPIPAVQVQADELNDHARVLSKAMAVHKKAVLVSSADPNLQDKVREMEDHYVVAIDNLDRLQDHIQEIELGGATDTHIAHNSILRDRLNRNSGLTETVRGNIGSNATATEVATADESTTIRFQFMVHKFREGVKDILKKVGWYMYHDDKVVFALGPEAQGQFMEFDEVTGEELGPMEEAWFQGGEFDEESGASYDALELEIEPYSMERTSEAMQQRRMAELDATMANIVPLMAQFPFVDWQKYLELRGEMMNLPNLGEMIDAEAAKEVAEAMMQIQLQGDGGTSSPQPRLGKDVGKLPQKTPGADRGRMAGVLSGVDIGSGGKRMEGLTNGSGAL